MYSSKKKHTENESEKIILISKLGYNGEYLQDSRISDPYKDTVKSWAVSKVEADRLWKLSEKLVGQEFSY
jgi:hypothetical protein